MQKQFDVIVRGSHLHGVQNGKYQVITFRSGNLKRACVNVLHGIELSEKYHYGLFQNDYGYVIRRKLRYIPEQEQSWEDVAEVYKIS